MKRAVGAFHTGRPNWFFQFVEWAPIIQPTAASGRSQTAKRLARPPSKGRTSGASALEADQHGERDQQLIARRLRQPRELRPVHQLHSLDIGEAHHNNARPEFDQLIQARDNAPQRPPLFAGPRAGLDMGLNASRPVATKTARHSLCLALGGGVVRSCEAERLEIGQALEDGADRAAGLSRDLGRRRHPRVSAKQVQIGLDNGVHRRRPHHMIEPCRLALLW